MRKFLLSILLLLSFSGLRAQLDLNELADVGRRILEAPEFAVRDSSNNYFKRQLKQFLSEGDNYKLELKLLNNMIRVADPNHKVAIYTWQMPDQQFNYVRFGLTVVPTKKGPIVTELHDALNDLTNVQERVLKAQEWPGALYYQLLPLKGEKKTFTLLGYAPGEKTHKKIIDAIEIRRNGSVRFGAKIFRVEDWQDKVLRKAPYRLILEYSSKYSVSVRWNENEKRIIMDNVAPPKPAMKGLYFMYGPDFSYNALNWDDDWWHLKSGVNFNTGQQIEFTPPSQPTGLPLRK
jgi:hypothetical protein